MALCGSGIAEVGKTRRLAMRSIEPAFHIDSPVFVDAEAEKAVVGYLCEGHGVGRVREMAPDIHSGWFKIMHAVYDAACYLEEIGSEVNGMSLTDHLNQRGQLDMIGGPSSLIPTNVGKSVVTYALGKLRDLYGKRKVEEVGNAMRKGLPPDAALKLLEQIEGVRLPPYEPRFTDLSPYLDGTALQEIPTVAEAWQGRCLFYEARLNEIHAEPAVGKTNVLMASCIAVLENGGKVLYIDPEDTPKGFATRMQALGASPLEIRENVYYLHNPCPSEIHLAQSWASRMQPDIVVLDGLAESMAAVGADENKAGDVLKFFRDVLRPFAEAGAAVVIADHVTKSSENRGQFARGSGAKAGRYDGVSYEIVSAVPYTPSKEGFVKLKVQKDRNGGVGPRNFIAAELHFTPNPKGGTIYAFRQPKEKQDGPFRPTAIMEKIVKHLETYESETKGKLRDLGNHDAAEIALKLLLEEGRVEMKKRGQSHVFSLKKAA